MMFVELLMISLSISLCDSILFLKLECIRKRMLSTMMTAPSTISRNQVPHAHEVGADAKHIHHRNGKQ
jgi:hypothetical protein